MPDMTKQIIKVANEIAQNVSKQLRNATLGCDSKPSEIDFMNMENRAFRAAVEVLSNHPLLDPDFAPITVDLGLFPPKPADHPNTFQVSCGDLVKYSTRQRSTDCFTVGQNYCVVNLSMDVVETTTDEGGIYQHARSEFFRRFDPAPQPAPDADKVKVNSGNVQDLYRQQIADGCFDGLKLVHLPTDIKRWISPIDGKTHFVDDEGWIYARGYNPVKSDTILTDRQYMAEFKVNKYKEGAIPAESAFWGRLLRFKLA